VSFFKELLAAGSWLLAVWEWDLGVRNHPRSGGVCECYAWRFHVLVICFYWSHGMAGIIMLLDVVHLNGYFIIEI
jgi:hypothetical protein